MFAAEEKTSEKDLEEVLGDLTALANQIEQNPDLYNNFAFEYDEEQDDFVAAKTYGQREFNQKNPFDELEQP
jgi:hypothetical protein